MKRNPNEWPIFDYVTYFAYLMAHYKFSDNFHFFLLICLPSQYVRLGCFVLLSSLFLFMLTFSSKISLKEPFVANGLDIRFEKNSTYELRASFWFLSPRSPKLCLRAHDLRELFMFLTFGVRWQCPLKRYFSLTVEKP